MGLLVLDVHLQAVFLKACRKRAEKRDLGTAAIPPDPPAPRRIQSTRDEAWLIQGVLFS